MKIHNYKLIFRFKRNIYAVFSVDNEEVYQQLYSFSLGSDPEVRLILGGEGLSSLGSRVLLV
jgi:hypothetical protein